MASKKKSKLGSKKRTQGFVERRTVNPPQPKPSQPQGDLNTGASFAQHDPQRRLGSFTGAGEHARTGNRGRQ
jgi:hypothetical protein